MQIFDISRHEPQVVGRYIIHYYYIVVIQKNELFISLKDPEVMQIYSIHKKQ